MRHNEEEVRSADGARWFDWEARPWRGADGEIRGVVRRRARHHLARRNARAAAAANEERLRMALEVGRSVVWEVDFKTRSITWHGDREAIYGAGFTFEQFDTNTHARSSTTMTASCCAAYFTDVARRRERQRRAPRACAPTATITLGREPGRAACSAAPAACASSSCISKDITERKRQEAAFIAAMQRAEAALRAKRALFGDIGDARRAEASIDEADVSVAEMYERLDSLMDEMDARDVVLAETHGQPARRARSGGRRQRLEVAIPDLDEPRTAHAAQRHHRLFGNPAWRRPKPTGATPTSPTSSAC